MFCFVCFLEFNADKFYLFSIVIGRRGRVVRKKINISSRKRLSRLIFILSFFFLFFFSFTFSFSFLFVAQKCPSDTYGEKCM